MITAGVFLAAATVRTASAAPGAIVVGGNAVEAQRAHVSSAALAVAHELGWTDGPSPPSKSELAALQRCTDTTTPWQCVPPALTSRGIQRILLVSVDRKPADGDPSALVLVGRLIVTDPGSSVVRQRFCEHCADDRLASEATELTRQLLREHAINTGRTLIAVRTEPPGAQVTLDGARIGASNDSFRTYPGAHVVVVTKSGFTPETRDVQVDEGESADVSIQLHAEGGTNVSVPPRETGPTRASPSRPSRLVPAVLAVTGTAALGIGIALQLTKDGPPLGEPQPARIYSVPGLALAGGGLALATIGTLLWLRASTSGPPRTAGGTASGPTFHTGADGTWIGWHHAY